MSSTYSIALSALQASSEAINTTGNNLANMNTDGFKGSTVSFKDLFGQTLGANNSFQVGWGVGVPISDAVFSQGPIQTSTSSYAAAIQGNGFFVVNSPFNQQLYTRDGNFTLDASGILKTQTGETVQGWMATPSGINASGVSGNIVLPKDMVLPAKATQNVSITANLDSSTPVGSATSGNYSVPVGVIDSLGNQHTLTFNFWKTDVNTWNYDVTIPGSDVAAGGSTPQSVLSSAPGTLSFDSNGKLEDTTAVQLALPDLADGAGSPTITWNLAGSLNNGLITQYSEASSSSSLQDGSQAAQLSGFAIQNGGQVVANFSDNQQRVVGQLALASIQNPDSLANVGNNNYAATSQTATPSIGLPQTGGRGQIDGGALENSNVDMATQFTNLIVYQSAYQAASRVITTADQMTQDLLNAVH
jgi:flagellar hook protein FlgE